jgi:hypothetical protein
VKPDHRLSVAILGKTVDHARGLEQFGSGTRIKGNRVPFVIVKEGKMQAT